MWSMHDLEHRVSLVWVVDSYWRTISTTHMGLSAGLVFRLWLNSEPGRDQLEILNLEQLPPEFFLLKIFSPLSRLGKFTVLPVPVL